MKEKMTLLRTIRKQANLSIFKLSELSGVSFEKVRQLDMDYRVEGTRLEIKEKIAFALKKNVWDVFPDVKAGMFRQMKEWEDEQKKDEVKKPEKQRLQFFAEPEIEKGQALLITLESIVINLKIKEEERPFYQKVLLRMTPEELGDIFHSGTFANEAKKKIRRFAKKYGVKSP